MKTIIKNRISLKKINKSYIIYFLFTLSLTKIYCQNSTDVFTKNKSFKRERIKLDSGWKFMRYKENADKLIYDVRPIINEINDSKVADSKPTEAIKFETKENVLKNWILPSANDFIKDIANKHKRPTGNPGFDFEFVKSNFKDDLWENVNIPHDWAIKEPFYSGEKPEVGGGMGRLPSHGVAWYRKKINFTSEDKDKSIYLEIDGAMSYAMVWLNGHLVGGWPYGYNSFRLDLTPYLNYSGPNQLAIRIDNPNHSSRWYPGGGIYRNVWITKMSPVHIAQWGTFVTTPKVSSKQASINLSIKLENKTKSKQIIDIITEIYASSKDGKAKGKAIKKFESKTISINADENQIIESSTKLNNPKLWGAYPYQNQNLYVAKTIVLINKKQIDEYNTTFGIRKIEFNPTEGILVNNKKIKIQGVNQHHDLGALGAAFNLSAAKRQLETLRELGCNAIRFSHNPPAAELLDLTDQMGFLVIDEIFDSWERKKTPHDFHLIFPDWYEPDTRAFIRRDRNHPSIIGWSFGNEVGEQYTDTSGALIAKKLHDIVKEEDPTRPASASQNYAKPEMPFSKVMDFISLNYQGEGIRDAPAYSHLTGGIHTSPLYPSFQKEFPNKLIISSETSSALSTRGSYIFPVTLENSAPVSDSIGGNATTKEVSSYELYTAQFGSSPDKVFATQDKHPYVSGEFVWSGWDYLGEPTPYYSARSSYCGIIDLAGFKKDRFYLYQSRWRPNLPIAHILPHWNWAGREGTITPVHIFTSGDEAELFLNGNSLGRKKKGKFEYRIRWDDVKYKAGELKVISYKNNKIWATEVIKTSENPVKTSILADKKTIKSDGEELTFITVKITDKNGIIVPNANNKINFKIQEPGEIVATDNGDPSNLTPFTSHEREAYNGMILVIVRATKGSKGSFQLIVNSESLEENSIIIKIK